MGGRWFNLRRRRLAPTTGSVSNLVHGLLKRAVRGLKGIVQTRLLGWKLLEPFLEIGDPLVSASLFILAFPGCLLSVEVHESYYQRAVEGGDQVHVCITMGGRSGAGHDAGHHGDAGGGGPLGHADQQLVGGGDGAVSQGQRVGGC